MNNLRYVLLKEHMEYMLIERKMELLREREDIQPRAVVHPLIIFSFTQIQRKLQLQVEEHSKYLETVIAKQNESLKKLGALRGFRDQVRRVLQDSEAPEERTHSAQQR
jgi:hypothetical protein